MFRLPENAEIIEVKAPQVSPIPDRPYVIQSETFKLKSPKFSSSLFVTIGYVRSDEKVRPYEIFINSKDLTKTAEYTVLSRLLSAIFRVAKDPSFVIEELNSIYDPNGGYYKEAKYMHSFYSEIADLIEQAITRNGHAEIKKNIDKPKMIKNNEISGFKLCPECNQLTAKYESGCITCTNEGCGYSKCSG